MFKDYVKKLNKDVFGFGSGDVKAMTKITNCSFSTRNWIAAIE